MRETLARRLRVERAIRDLGLTEAAKMLGIQKDTLSALEHGKRGAYSGTLEKIARGYGLTVAELLGEEDAGVPKAGAPGTGRLPRVNQECYTLEEITGVMSTLFVDTQERAVNRLVADLTGEPMGYYGTAVVGAAVDRFHATMADAFDEMPEHLEHSARRRREEDEWPPPMA
jgi:transcriptional regulator with XRE-family HTH domain